MTNGSTPPSRQLVVCCDGTSNTLTAGVADTNVVQLHAHLNAAAVPAGVERVLYYDPGVGTADAAPPTDPIDWFNRSARRISGLASGRGVYENISQAYLFLMRNWRNEHDRIYCFGFSRGAFTVRCVVGMVHLFGILKPEHEALLPTLISIYFSLPSQKGNVLQEATRNAHEGWVRIDQAAVARGARNAHPDTREALAQQVRALFTSPEGGAAWVHWVGVWDTVESVGLPGPLARTSPSRPTLHDKRVRNVRHALALDEHRWTFEPRLYEEPGDIDDGVRTLKQRWFPGVHCDVGGSYRATEAGLSDEALEWMVAEVANDMGVPQLAPSTARRVRHDALWATPWWALAGMSLRNMRPATYAGAMLAIAASNAAAPSSSVWERRRSPWSVGAALVLGVLCLLASGICLLPSGWAQDGFFNGLLWAARAAAEFAGEQFASLWGKGLLAPDHAPWHPGIQAGWAMLWDFAFIAAWGYLLARIASRAFAWLAGSRGPSSGMPRWRWLGMAPLAAVGGDVAENASTLLALALHGLGVDLLAYLLLWLGGLAALTKFGGLIACLPLLGVRLWVALGGGRPPPGSKQ